MMTTDYAADPAIAAMRAKIARFGGMLYQRHLTDAAGGNLTARVGDVLCMSPRYAGSQYQWQLTADDVLVVDLDGNILVGGGSISRESKVHLRLHREFGEHGTGVIHAHARNVLVYAVMQKSIPPILEATRKFGEIPVTPFAPSHTPQLAEHIADAIRGNESRIRKQAAGAIAPWHGLFVMGKDIDAAFDAVERIDNSAYILMMSGLLGGKDGLAEQRAALEAAIAPFEKG
jgi:ribulose-5-phosphate 4-epimerase/fuculose-1-phosphate aldolase